MSQKPSAEHDEGSRPPRKLEEKGIDVVNMPLRPPTGQVLPQNTGTSDPDVD
ncbi:hypothetical protein CSO01_05520 [Cellulomonas soli]|uniref:Uncharacterized protein n=1 Tax=Cellulomonas soli TaxID=931535 RepID=A0A512P9E9_9CELL|nr:hypothetical protein [Cellulomonas soli]GEP67837.1 hypothetical protein CSO01_05520 [Cellulomonas soli]